MQHRAAVAANVFGILADDGTTLTLHAATELAWRSDGQPFAAIRIAVRRFLRQSVVSRTIPEVAIAAGGIVLERVTAVLSSIHDEDRS